MAEIPLQQLLPLRLGLSSNQVAEFCQRWQIDEFALFRSVLRSDFRADSDIDILISYCPEASHGLLARVWMKDSAFAYQQRALHNQIKELLYLDDYQLVGKASF